MNRRFFIASLAAAATFGTQALAQSNANGILDALYTIHSSSMQKGYDAWKKAINGDGDEVSAAINVLSDIISYANNVAEFSPTATNANTLIGAAANLSAASIIVSHIKSKVGGKSRVVDRLIIAAEKAIIDAEKAVQERLKLMGIVKKKQKELEKELEPSPIIQQLQEDGLL